MGTPQRPSSHFEPNIEPRSRIQGTHNPENPEGRTHLSNRTGVADAWRDERLTKSIGFADELVDTARYFVQHALVTMIFVLKLCALPLVYFVQLLAGSRDWRCMTAASFPQSPSAIFDQASIRDIQGPNPRPMLAYIIDAVTLPFRMTRTLYEICKILQQHPEVLSRLGSQNIHASDTDKGYNLGNQTGRVLLGASSHNIVGAPASTEVYHATLSECGDLTEVLATFDLDSSSRGSLLSEKDCQVPEGTAQYERLRSLQNTPPEMRRSLQQSNSPVAVKMALLHPNGFACLDSVSRKKQDSLAPSPTERRLYTPKVWDRLARIDDQRHMSLPEECVGHNMKELLGDSDVLEKCPTHMRRHRRSLLPRRLGTQSAINLGYGGGGTSQETLPIGKNPPPVKGARLKKKRPVKELPNNSSMTSLWRRF